MDDASLDRCTPQPGRNVAGLPAVKEPAAHRRPAWKGAPPVARRPIITTASAGALVLGALLTACSAAPGSGQPGSSTPQSTPSATPSTATNAASPSTSEIPQGSLTPFACAMPI